MGGSPLDRKIALPPAVAVFLLAPMLAAMPAAAGTTCTVTPNPYWKTAIDFPAEPFAAPGQGAGQPGFVKLTILVDPCDPGTVYYQDTVAYPFHHGFASEQLDPFLGLSVEAFGAVTLYNDGRQALLGAVVLPPPAAGQPPIQEYGVQFISEDPLDPQLVIDAFQAVRGSVAADPGVRAFYFPTFEQQASAEQHAALFAAAGITVSSPARWAPGNGCYSKGWALGRLTFVPAGQIGTAFLSGELRPDDVLLTDGVPAEMPLVAGVLSLEPATPNSHVVILASTFGIPFVFLGDDGDAQRAQELVGRRVVVSAFDEFAGFDSGGGCLARLIDVEDQLTQQQIDEILELKQPPPLDIQPVAPLGSYARTTDVLTPAEIDHFGGKAANFGFLRRSIPDSSPRALGLSFDLWMQFLGQEIPGGQAFGEWIAGELAAFDYPPADPQALAVTLESIRSLVTDDGYTVFAAAQRSAVVAALQDPQFMLDPLKKIRFRSSTNVEDSEQFTGAGLYDSFSGCLADDLDGDGSGPSHCDAGDGDERGVFRAIRKVFASFYNDSAVLERLRHGVDEADAGMAILVHHSFPDEIELANGVATFRRDPATSDRVTLVTQLGASPVTDPEPGAVPEVVKTTIFSPGSIVATHEQASNLVLLGQTVLDFPAEYVELTELLLAAADRFQNETGKADFLLDFEYKKVEPGGGALPAGGLVVKQIREIPRADTTPSITPFLVNEPTTLVPFGGVPGRVDARWTLSTENQWLDPAAVADSSIYTGVEMSFTDGCRLRELSGAVSDLPGAAHTYDPVAEESVDGWTLAELPNPRSYGLRTPGLGTLVSEAESPILTLRDLARSGLPVTVEHQDPVPLVPGSGMPVTTETVTMIPALDPGDEVPVCRELSPGGGVTVETCYRIHPPPAICAGCAPILSRFIGTTIRGLTSAPIVLDHQFSQSYNAGNHAFFETFTFEPLLEPGVPLTSLQELLAQDVRLIRIDVANLGEEPEVTLMLLDDPEVGQSCPAPAPAGDLPANAALVAGKAPAGEIVLSWGASCLAGDDDFAVYEGTLGAFAGHAPRRCTTGGAASVTLAPAGGDTYYLVVPRNANVEGSYGTGEGGAERPAAAEACTAQAPGPCG